jgi:Fic family protein
MRRTGSEYSTIAGQFDSSKGEFRLCNVSAGIGGRSYLAYNKVPKAVEDFCKWLNNEIAKIDRKKVAYCYRLSFEAHFRLVSIHPWVDGNGRTTRLVMNMIQRQLGLIPSIVRKEEKGEYIQSLVDSRENDDSTITQDTMLRHHIANLHRRISEYQQNGCANDTVSPQYDTLNDTVNNLKDSLKRIYLAIQKNPDITHSEIMEIFHISESTAKRATRELKKIGLIKRDGSDKTGKWIIL